jgi:hypothetical protein
MNQARNQHEAAASKQKNRFAEMPDSTGNRRKTQDKLVPIGSPIRQNKKVKVKLSLRLTNYALCHEDVRGIGCIDPHFLDLGTSWR